MGSDISMRRRRYQQRKARSSWLPASAEADDCDGDGGFAGASPLLPGRSPLRDRSQNHSYLRRPSWAPESGHSTINLWTQVKCHTAERKSPQTTGDPPSSGDHGSRPRKALHKICWGFLQDPPSCSIHQPSARVRLADSGSKMTVVTPPSSHFQELYTVVLSLSVTGVSCTPSTEMPPLRGGASFQQGFISLALLADLPRSKESRTHAVAQDSRP